MNAAPESDTPSWPKIGARVRAARDLHKLSLEAMADRIEASGYGRPSTAKLSRIETGIQPIPVDILGAIAAITGIRMRELRPDLASLFAHEAAE